MAKTSKLDKLGNEAKAEVMEWKGSGMSDQDISNKIKDKYGIDIHVSNVGRFVKKHLHMIASVSKGETKVRDEAVEEWNKMKDDMTRIKDELWAIIDFMKVKGDARELRNTLSELSKHIERMNVLLGHIVDIRYEEVDITSISSRIPQILESLEKQGYIEIKKKIPK